MLPIDHVTVAGLALEPMRAALAAVGIDTVYGGAHRDGVTEMAMVSFPDGSYLELIALQSHAPPDLVERHPWSRYLTGNAGPCAWAVSTSDLDGEVNRLRAAGIAVPAPVSNGRLRPDGVRLEWRTAACGAGPAGSFFPFVIEDLTPRDLRAFPPGMPGHREFGGIARVVLAVHNLDAALARYHQAYGLDGAIQQSDPSFGAQLAIMGDAPVALAQPLDGDSWLAARLARFGEAPCAVLLAAAGAADLAIRWIDSLAIGWRLGLISRLR